MCLMKTANIEFEIGSLAPSVRCRLNTPTLLIDIILCGFQLCLVRQSHQFPRHMYNARYSFDFTLNIFMYFSQRKFSLNIKYIIGC